MLFSGFVLTFLTVQDLFFNKFFAFSFLGIAILILFFIFSPLFNFLIYKLSKYSKKITISQFKMRIWQVLSLFSIFILWWFFYGLGLIFIVKALSLNINPIYLIGINTASWLLGYLSFLTPSGLGVREVAMVFFLKSKISVALAGSVSIISRLVFVIAELFAFLLVFILNIFNKSYENRN